MKLLRHGLNEGIVAKVNVLTMKSEVEDILNIASAEDESDWACRSKMQITGIGLEPVWDKFGGVLKKRFPIC